MRDVDQYPIYSVVVDPEYCPQCGTEVGTREFDAGTYHWCDECEMSLARVPVAAVHVVVRDGDEVLLLDEPIPQHEGHWSLPGGYAGYHEDPEETGLRELREETGLRADPGDLELVTVIQAATEEVGFHFTTYALDRADADGEIRSEAEGFEVLSVPVDEALGPESRLRENDQERVAAAFET